MDSPKLSSPTSPVKSGTPPVGGPSLPTGGALYKCSQCGEQYLELMDLTRDCAWGGPHRWKRSVWA
jgi:hypothetical protein